MLMSFTTTSVTSAKSLFNYSVAPMTAGIKWVTESHDFGDIPRGVPVSFEFAFTNSGDEALIIKDVITSCGCTASDYTREPIMPGKSSKIKVTYNAASAGAFTKSITVNSNSKEASMVLLIKGIVK